MTRTTLTLAALSMAAPALAFATPAAAYAPMETVAQSHHATILGSDTFENRRDRYRHYNNYNHGRGYDRGRYDEPVYRDTRVWRGNDGRQYCRRKDGTTGLLIGGAAGALLGREVAGRNGDRTLGAILGAAGGALLGREIDRGGSTCR